MFRRRERLLVYLSMKWAIWNYLMDWSFGFKLQIGGLRVQYSCYVPKWFCNLFDSTDEELAYMDAAETLRRIG